MTSQTIINDSFYAKTDDKQVVEALRKAVLEVLEDLTDECKHEVPVDTGHLQKHHFTDSTTEGAKVHGMVKVGEAEYWQDVQYGTRYQNANPYITRAISNTQPTPKAVDYFQQYLTLNKQ